MRKAPCISADQSQMQGAATKTTGALVLIVYHGPLQKSIGGFC